jgi:protein-S-isoprenylcysteine O-methyltransferase Ste14
MAEIETVAATSKPSWIVQIPTPLWLIGLIILALGANVLLKTSAIVQHRPTGAILILVGVAFSVWAAVTFRMHRAQIKPTSDAHSTLVASGPFLVSRNPMYLGTLVTGIGAALVAGTWLMWAVPVVLFVLDNFVIIPFEERSMERTFGATFGAYKNRVRRWV